MAEKKSVASKDYLDQYISYTKNIKKVEKRIEKMNRYYAREDFKIDPNRYLLLNDGNQRLSNFFVYPTDKLYFDDGNSLEMDGVGIIAYTKINDKHFKKVFLNLSFDLIESGEWVKPQYLDTDYDLFKSAYYPYLRSALKIATRRIGSYDVKIFNDEYWIEDDEAYNLLDDYQSYLEGRRLWGIIKEEETEINQEAYIVLKSIEDYIHKHGITPYGEQPDNNSEHAGWQNDEYYFLWGKKFWEWVKSEEHIKNELVFNEKEINMFLMEKDIIRFEKEKSGRIRFDTWETVYPGFKKRFYTLEKSKMHDFLKSI